MKKNQKKGRMLIFRIADEVTLIRNMNEMREFQLDSGLEFSKTRI